MSMGTAQEARMKLPGPTDVVGVGALAREEAEIFLAAHCGAHAELAHVPPLEAIGFGGLAGSTIGMSCSGRTKLPTIRPAGLYTPFAPGGTRVMPGHRSRDIRASEPLFRHALSLPDDRTPSLR